MALNSFAPAAMAPPYCDNSCKVIQHYRNAQGRSGGTGIVSSVTMCFAIWSKTNGFYRPSFFSTGPSPKQGKFKKGFESPMRTYYANF